MTDFFPVCPHCKADARHGATFNMTDDIDETIIYSRGHTMEAREQIRCLNCSNTFPLWTYVVGQPKSKKWNAVLEEGTSPPGPDLPPGMAICTAFERS